MNRLLFICFILLVGCSPSRVNKSEYSLTERNHNDSIRLVMISELLTLRETSEKTHIKINDVKIDSSGNIEIGDITIDRDVAVNETTQKRDSVDLNAGTNENETNIHEEQKEVQKSGFNEVINWVVIIVLLAILAMGFKNKFLTIL